jgi:beta-lactamase regulating signal transducer with metallopeptidase domain
MNAWMDAVSGFLQNSNFAAVFLDAALKSLVLLAIAGGVCLWRRRVSAATRHLIWFLAVSSLPCLPLLSSVNPSWQRPLWSVSSGLNSGNEISLALELAPAKETGISAHGPPTFPAATAPPAPGHSQSRSSRIAVQFGTGWLVLAMVVWFSGMALFLISAVIGQLRLGKISRRACPLQGSEWTLLLKESCETLRLRPDVTLLQSAQNVMPLTWGWRRPVLLLPAEAGQWPEGRRRVVLLHELAHVKRRDCLMQSVARIVCAVYWFNPLVWLAARRMCIERERACDDLVLTGGCRASDYASHLVEIAKAFRPVPQVAAIAMARSSGLEQRVTAILDDCRNRNSIAKPAVAFIAVAVLVLEVFVGGYAQERTRESWSLERSKVAEQLKHFVAEKRAQAIAGAKAEGREMLPEYEAMFAAAAKGDWNGISNIWENLRVRAGQYDLPGPKDERLRGTPWQTMLEIWAGFGGIIVGGEDNPVSFANDVITSIPPGSIYFGGTDPGRCVITALQKSHVNADPFFTLTQNALADATYLQYLRGMYGGRIYTPTDEDSQKCFQEYLADAQRRLAENKLKPGEDVKMVDGRVQVSGQVVVMSINGLLTKIIFDKNPDREFFVEESFPLDWMYPHLEPHGLIMKISRPPVAELSEELVQRDRAHWRGPVTGMIGNWLELETSVKRVAEYAERTYAHEDPKKFVASRFIAWDNAHKWLSKWRSSIGGLYAWRAQHASSESEKDRMVREADFAFRQAWALCPYSPEAVFRYVNLLLSQNRTSDALLIAETAASIDEENGQLRDLAKKLKESQRAR